jgi:hypothetical protein
VLACTASAPPAGELAPVVAMVPVLTSRLATRLPPCRYTPLAELPLVEMVPLLMTVLPGPSVEMPCELPPVVTMLPLLVMSVRVLLFDVTRMPAVPPLVVRMAPLLVSALSLPVATMAARAEPEPPETVIWPLLVMLLASRTSSACVALVASVAPGFTVMATPVLPGTAITLAEPVVAPSQLTLVFEPGVAVGPQAALAPSAANAASVAARQETRGEGRRCGTRRDRVMLMVAPGVVSCARPLGWGRARPFVTTPVTTFSMTNNQETISRSFSCCPGETLQIPVSDVSAGGGNLRLAARPGKQQARAQRREQDREDAQEDLGGADEEEATEERGDLCAHRRTTYRVTTGAVSPRWNASRRSRSAMSLAVARLKRRRWSVHESSTICST